MSASILLVDDEPELLEELATFLSRQGYRVLCVGNGREALTLLGTTAVDLVITDNLMPEMTGRELIAAIRAVSGLEGLPVILISAVRMASDVPAQAQHYFHKPFRLAELAAVIQNLLAAARSAKPGP